MSIGNGMGRARVKGAQDPTSLQRKEARKGQVTGRPPICPLNGAPFRNKLSKIKVRPRRGP